MDPIKQRPGATSYEVGGFAVPRTLSLLHALLEQAAADHPQVDADHFMLFEIAVMELAGNVVRHGGPPGDVEYSFRLQVHPDRLVGVLADTGQEAPFDPQECPEMPDATEESGRGLPIVHASVDDLHYERQDGLNRWRMTRLIGGDPGATRDCSAG